MTCTKTGCQIFIEQYGEYAYGDAFEISPFRTKDPRLIEVLNRSINNLPVHSMTERKLGEYVVNIAYFKIVRRSFRWINFPILHYTVHDFEEIIGSHDSGSEIERDFWPPVVLLTNNYTFHGHSGRPIPVGAE